MQGICAVMEVTRHCPGSVGPMGSVSAWGGQGRPQKERVMKPGRVQRVCRTPSGRVGDAEERGPCSSQREQQMQKPRQERTKNICASV